MKKRAKIMEELHDGMETMEQELVAVEAMEQEMTRRLQELLEKSTVMIRAGEKAPAYMSERVKRLHSLIRKLIEERGYSPSAYHPLHRQIDRIRDTDLSDFFSPALSRRIDSMYGKRQEDANAVFYELGNVRFCVFGKIVETVEGVDFERGESLARSRGVGFLFPETAEGFEKSLQRCSLMFVELHDGEMAALFCERVTDKRMLDRFGIRRELTALSEPHRFVEGYFLIEGQRNYLIHPDSKIIALNL